LRDLEQFVIVIVAGRSLSGGSGVFLDVELDVMTLMRRVVDQTRGRALMMRLLFLADHVIRDRLVCK